MAFTYEELQKKTVAELRDIAKGIDHDETRGSTQMNKDRLIPAICQALGIDAHVHHHVTDGFDKSAIKSRLRELKSERERALETHDLTRLHDLRRERHMLNHRIRSHMV
jgi:hypothetical protein